MIPLAQLAEQITAAMLGGRKKRFDAVARDFAAEWQLVCLIESGWVNPDGLTEKGREKIETLARELGVLS